MNCPHTKKEQKTKKLKIKSSHVNQILIKTHKCQKCPTPSNDKPKGLPQVNSKKYIVRQSKYESAEN